LFCHGTNFIPSAQQNEVAREQPGSGGHAAFEPQAALSVMVMMVMVMIKVVVVMMVMGSECRAGKRHQE
jgi:hypothetical protein